MGANGNGQRPDYGIDAPGVVWKLALYGLGGLLAGQSAFMFLRSSRPRLARVPRCSDSSTASFTWVSLV